MDKLQLRNEIEVYYRKAWNEWFPEGVNPATLEVEFPSSYIANLDSGYFIKEDRIKIVIADGDFRDLDNVFNQGWPIWKREIVHEMCHEYQYKCVLSPSDEGKQLHSKYQNCNFPGLGHDEYFYTAIVELAKKDKLDTDEFIKKI